VYKDDTYDTHMRCSLRGFSVLQTVLIVGGALLLCVALYLAAINVPFIHDWFVNELQTTRP